MLSYDWDGELMEKSKFFSLKSKDKKNTDKPVEKTESAFTDVEVEELLATVGESMQVIAEIREASKAVPPEVKEEILDLETKEPLKRKAYNIWRDDNTKCYMLDVVEYGIDDSFSVETRKLSSSQPMAMYEIKKIFTNKLILKKEGM